MSNATDHQVVKAIKANIDSALTLTEYWLGDDTLVYDRLKEAQDELDAWIEEMKGTVECLTSK
jgi:hypothetical protein